MGFLRIFGAMYALGVVGTASAPADLAAPQAETCTPADQCCKICSKGKACGNTCISRSYVCHQGRGCACNADEVCE